MRRFIRPAGEGASYYNCNLFNKQGQFLNQVHIMGEWLQAATLNLSKEARSESSIYS